MKHLKQIAIILAVSFAGEALHSLIPLPVPGSIYGLLLMLALLMTGVVKIHEVKAVGDWLITLMPIMFVAPTAGLISGFDSYRGFIIPIIVIVLVTTPLTMAVTGKTVEGLMRVEERKRKERRHNDK